ncbi:hypothetical protein F4803DRAFT_540664 [Xylaria telfairii]|nr:hypothetical protein F4803DRAFT_540664 [Xylaria telfairii]
MLSRDAKKSIAQPTCHPEVFEMESPRTEKGTRRGSMGELDKDSFCVVSNWIDQLEDYTTVVPRKLAEGDDYDQRQVDSDSYNFLVIRGLILSRFPVLCESILRLLVKSVVERREALLSLRNGRSSRSWRCEPDKDQDSSDTESTSSVQSPCWNDHPYPDPPEGGDAKTKRCDWCHDDLDVSKLKDIAWWRKHFLRDLQPYVCLAGCEYPRMLFSKFHEWQDHMDFFHDEDWIEKLQKLDEWHRDITSCPSEEQQFIAAQKLESHSYPMQGIEVPPAQIALIPNKTVASSPNELATCPLCHHHVSTEGLTRDIIDDDTNEQSSYSKTLRSRGGSVTDESTDMPLLTLLEDSTSQELETRELLVRHIAKDIKWLAFLSLKDLDSDNPRGEPPNSRHHRKTTDGIFGEDNGSEASLSVCTSGSPQPDLGTLSDRDVSVRPESSTGAKYSARDDTNYVDRSRLPRISSLPRCPQTPRLPTPAYQDSSPATSYTERVRQRAYRRGQLSALADAHLAEEPALTKVYDRPRHHIAQEYLSLHHRRMHRWYNGQDGPRYFSDLSLEDVNFRDEINDALVESAFDSGRRFLPEGSLKRLVTSKNIRGALAYWGTDDEETQTLVDFVLTEARKIFIIIVDTNMINVGDALESLRKSGVTDRHLPLPQELIECKRIKDQLTEKDCHHDAALDAFHKKPWRRSAVSAFYHSQWQFLAPLFTPGHVNIKLDAKAILPLVHVGRDARMGFFSEVYEVELHRDHHQGIVPSEDGRELHVALKELRMDAHDDEIRRIFEHETRSLKALRDFRHKHMITAIASVARGERRYFIFPWADGEDLRAFWMTKEFWPLTPHLIQETVKQLGGLASALYTLHQGGWRHGDVKPENILRFKDQTTLGTLKLGDLGLAKTHHLDTALRHAPTETRVGTMRYEPPETVTSNNAPRSRKYDIWSMGCVIMEFVIWLLYGPTGLNEFSRALSKDNTFGEAFYSTRQGGDRELQAEVHPVVRLWLDQISQNPDWPRNSAIADLLRLIATHLLVVRTSTGQLPSSTGKQSTSGRSIVPQITIGMHSEPNMSSVRADAKILLEQLELILDKCLTNPEYLFPRAARGALYRRAIPGHRTPHAKLLANQHVDALKPSALRVSADPKRLSLLSRAREAEEYNDKQENSLKDSWEYITDNHFASRLFKSLGSDVATTPRLSADKICDYCTGLDFCVSGFPVAYSIKYLEGSAVHCRLCFLLKSVLTRNGLNYPDSPTIRLERYESIIKLQTGGPPVLSIVADPGNLKVSPTKRLVPGYIQIGFPNLYDHNSAVPRHLLRGWLANCDSEHKCISTNDSNRYIPKRILLIENDGAPTVRLVETAAMTDRLGPYITLSYVWGSHNTEWRLERSNYARFQDGMRASELPHSFRDAALVALQIGIPYLWIDALCVVHDGQFDIETDIKDRDRVFQGSHCTISLSSAVTVNDGFLKPRRRREAVQMKRANGGVYYVCELIDDFNKDVEESPLSSRGWAFQERVLSRRTIFFTHTQAYWQCGDGIRCETLTKLENWRSRILGDPDFPKRSLKILRPIQTFQQFYERYSLLRFGFGEDRFYAIQPLETRLLQGLRSKGAYGVVARFLHRSLLWRRGPGQTLERITFPDGKYIPSWSWQAYIGGITYLHMPPENISWNPIRCWFAKRDFDRSSEDVGEFEAEAWDFDFQTLSTYISNNLTVVWDRGEHGRRHDLKCITVGSSKVSSDGIGHICANYLLIVAPSADYERFERFERLGVGYMDGLEPSSKKKSRIRVC